MTKEIKVDFSPSFIKIAFFTVDDLGFVFINRKSTSTKSMINSTQPFR